ncbi:MAG TPA: PVC-type heme-binding CxxCH protein [Gemmataceae bacterium]|jgi:putative membrane-bound dehydrogenase-like protein|nr:PVC-type heme-binding CxxCH protein [Gemmataceae bacterium]
MTRHILALAIFFFALSAATAGDGNLLTYLDENNPYYPNRNFPKLTTPMWVGEDGVEAVVIIAIDDMRGHEKWETFLRPILNRLKKIDGRAPVSIMTCQIDPKDPHLQGWLKEGVSLECHTIDHPCPLLKDGDFAKAKSTYDRCVDMMNEIPGNKPVAFRMPCCDSLNTNSPRFYAEIFNKKTAKDHFLQIDSSVFNIITANDPELPRELVLEPDGTERFRKYIPTGKSFVNTIEDYPYPYVINRLCWEFPCMTPSDWQSFNLQKAGHPKLLQDWKAALDAVVLKKGVFTMVCHPYGWSTPEQHVALIDYAVQKYGKKVKFLTFKEALERLEKNVLGGQSLREAKTGNDNGVRLLDLDEDGFMDVLIANEQVRGRRCWHPIKGTWEPGGYPPFPLNDIISMAHRRFRRLQLGSIEAVVAANDKEQVVLVPGRTFASLEKAPFTLPAGAKLSDPDHDYGLRFIDIDEDGNDDIVFSNEKEYGIYLFTDMEHGWSRKVMAGKAGEPGALPPIAINGKDNGFFVHSRSLWWQNEHTAMLKDLVDRRSFNDLLMNVEPQAKKPEQSAKCLQARPGFQVELLAAEPLVQSPISFAFGPDGKLWVVEMHDYPLSKGSSKIKFLESTKGDGKYDKATVFLEGLSYPTGVLPWRDGIIVTCAPEIFFVENKDGKPGRKEVLYTGFKEGNPQHRVNGPVWGLDNWLYVANGDSGGIITSPQRKQGVDISGRDLRIRPDTGEIETVTGGTQYGRSRDDWGNWFGGNNSNPVWHYVLPDQYLKRNPHYAAPRVRADVPAIPGVAPVYPRSRTLPRFNDPFAFNRFTSANSPIVYRDELFYSVAYASGSDDLAWTFVSEPVHDLVHREIMVPAGATFKSRRAADEMQSEFLASSDNWFRPTMLQTGPDGCVWVCDMYRAVIEHPEWIPKETQKKIDLRAGSDMGRIYRVVPVSVQPRPIPRLDKLDTAGLVAALDSPNGWQRDMAQMMLIWKDDPAAVPLLEKLAFTSERPLARLHALCTLDGMNRFSPDVVQKALHDVHPGIRRHALRLSERFLASNPELAKAVANYPVAAFPFENDPQTRLQLAFTLGECPDPQAAITLGKLALAYGDDLFMRSAIMSSINARNLQPLLRVVLEESKGSPVKWVDSLLNMAIAFGNKDALKSMLSMLAEPKDGRFTAWQMTALADWLDSLEQKNAKLAPEAADKLQAIIAAASEKAGDSKADISERALACRLLGRMSEQEKPDLDSLTALLSAQQSPEVQTAAIAALGRMKTGEAGKRLLAAWKTLGPARRSQALELLQRREETLKSVLDALENKQIEPSEVDAIAKQRLLTHKSEAIRQRAAKLFANTVAPDRQKVIESFRPALSLKGDAKKGAGIFTKTCAACHKLGNVGNEVGPDLAALGGRSPEYLMVAILDPNQSVEARYIQYLAETKGGLSFAGVLTNETATSITIVTTDGKANTILRSNLESLTSTGRSAMPEGLEKDWKHQDLADLLAHLRTSQTMPKRKSFDGNNPFVIKPEPGGSLKLAATQAEIYGPNLIFEKQYLNLGYWSHQDDFAAWTVDVPAAGKYSVTLDYACENSNAGNTFVVETDGGQLLGKVAGTGTWDNYKSVNIGEITLAAGQQRLSFRPTAPVKGALIDLRMIRLVKVEK